MMKIFVEEAACPPGALSFIAGSAGDLLDHLLGQDMLAFTGSGDTGWLLRGGRSALAHSVRVNVAADSLNAAVQGPDVQDGSDLQSLLLDDVVRDMTQKAGQKCTAIRRVYVPKGREDDALERLRERLAAVKVGNPALAEVTMGPLATSEQLTDVRRGVLRLQTSGQIVFGSTSQVAPIGDGVSRGFFMSPVLLFNAAPEPTDAAHTREVFGPVATIMPYDGSAAHAAFLVRAGGGGLVSTVYSDDRAFVRDLVRRIAPFHGRVTVSSSGLVGQALPPGTALPQLIHGGPGRAGGGEELGGRRGLAFYMQRVALQGDRSFIEGLLRSE
jgi:oxepin-CoA hydrolase/3-oxo-5,6-dehydrosuberyl-CoA semialdehyde dehydrogenase